MNLNIAAAVIGVSISTGSVLSSVSADMETKDMVITFLEANARPGLADEMLPNVLDSLVKLYDTGTVDAADITRYGTYLSEFHDLKSLFYETAESVGLSELAVRVGEYFMLSIGVDPLQPYGRLLHSLSNRQRETIETTVWRRWVDVSTRRRELQGELQQFQVFSSEAARDAFVDAVFVSYIHSHLWTVEKRERFQRSPFTSREYFQSYLRISKKYTPFGREESAFLAAFEELQNQGVIEVRDARDPAMLPGIRHTLATIPLRPGEVVVVPVLAMLAPVRTSLKKRDDLRFFNTLYPMFREAIRTRNFDKFEAALRERGYDSPLNAMFTRRSEAYIRFLSPWRVPASTGNGY